ncbi:hypothetical protein DPEC_G00269330 [Dallia pectoralis]|uniref:Uncharacterized protein n=1 Tax=Dallia pectoralis TaxID=75939 RepID=A0ACC2FP42_DALPE|nr:hypothetical protein DPEC_G00269330 [Dallia pectoralis]
MINPLRSNDTNRYLQPASLNSARRRQMGQAITVASGEYMIFSGGVSCDAATLGLCTENAGRPSQGFRCSAGQTVTYSTDGERESDKDAVKARVIHVIVTSRHHRSYHRSHGRGLVRLGSA